MLKDSEFLSVVQLAPLVAIDVVVVRREYEVLLGLRNNKPAQGYWFTPGGRIWKGELLADALTRIGSQELGRDLAIGQGKLLGVFEHFYEDCFAGHVGVNTHYVVLAYRFDVADGFEIGNHDFQHSKMRWWSLVDASTDDAEHANTRAYLNYMHKSQAETVQ